MMNKSAMTQPKRAKRTAKQRVLRKWPDAYTIKYFSAFGDWHVMTPVERNAGILGDGRTPIEAWSNAAENLSRSAAGGARGVRGHG